jgi:signal transduction histidine kinase
LDAAALVFEVAREFSTEPSAKGHRIICAPPGRALPVMADREALSRAVWNLLDNAVKYSPDQPEVVAETAAAPGGVAIRVTDRGIGIPREEQGRLFQKFVRGESIRKRGIPGTGIGLAMVRHIAEAHGGRVELRSAEGQGSSFSIFLPNKE